MTGCPDAASSQEKPKKKPADRCRTVRDKRTGAGRRSASRASASSEGRRAEGRARPRPAGGLLVPSSAALPNKLDPAGRPRRLAPAPRTGCRTGLAASPAIREAVRPLPDLPEKGALTRRDAERLLWRAGLRPPPRRRDRLAGTSARAAVEALTRVSGDATLTGAAPRDQAGNPIDPHNVWGHDHLWWLDRMVRGISRSSSA
jgi:hypothetical protein